MRSAKIQLSTLNFGSTAAASTVRELDRKAENYFSHSRNPNIGRWCNRQDSYSYSHHNACGALESEEIDRVVFILVSTAKLLCGSWYSSRTYGRKYALMYIPPNRLKFIDYHTNFRMRRCLMARALGDLKIAWSLVK